MEDALASAEAALVAPSAVLRIIIWLWLDRIRLPARFDLYKR
jgi:hypothetical protein